MDEFKNPLLDGNEIEELLGTLAPRQAAASPQRSSGANAPGDARMTLWTSYSSERYEGFDYLDRAALEAVLSKAGATVAITPALRRVFQRMIYGDADPSEYYLTLLDNGRLIAKYHRIIGQRFVGLVSPEMLQRVAERAGVVDVARVAPALMTLSAPRRVLGVPRAPIVEVDTRAVDADVMAVLRDCTADDRAVYLPPRQLAPKLYQKINLVLEALGGKWNRSRRGHVFAEDPREVLATVQVTGTFLNPKDFGFFGTPGERAGRVIELADIQPGMEIFEPSAGSGALADAAAAIVGVSKVTTAELLGMNAAKLRAKGYHVMEGDFLAMTPRPVYDRVVMNPPFGGQADMLHVEHAARFLKPDGKLVAIMSPSFEFRSTRQAAAFRALYDAAGVHREYFEAGAFRESGTEVRTVVVKLDAARLPWNGAVDGDRGVGDTQDTDSDLGEYAHLRERAV